MPDRLSGSQLKRIARLMLKGMRLLSFACLVYCGLGLWSSVERNYPLWTEPIRTNGTVIDFSDVSWQTQDNGIHFTTSTKLPIVEFKDDKNQSQRFTDRIGRDIEIYQSVPVIYANQDSANARIDRGILNWFDTYIWLFGTLGGLLGVFQLSDSKVEERLAMLDTNNDHI